MRLYSYVVTHDTGFAPNPFFGFCTLACCKPIIRKTAEKGDWIVGLTPGAAPKKIVYFMRVDEVMESYADYWSDPRFQAKRPSKAGGVRGKCGDNIYQPLETASGGYRQLPSTHSNKENREIEDEENKARDLAGKRVLVSENFAYFGSNGMLLPPELSKLIVGRGHRCNLSEELKDDFLRFTKTVNFGLQGAPKSWPEGEDSWASGCGCTPRRKR
jgi:hypothetical protein